MNASSRGSVGTGVVLSSDLAFTSAVIILSISLIIAFILLVWKKKEKVSEKISVSDSGLNKYHPTAHHQAHHMPNQIPNVHHTTSHEQKNNP